MKFISGVLLFIIIGVSLIIIWGTSKAVQEKFCPPESQEVLTFCDFNVSQKTQIPEDSNISNFSAPLFPILSVTK
jgi:hypothetical protein